MGMFDYLNCNRPLPDGAPVNPYQTKSLLCEMHTYEIRENGELWGESSDGPGWERTNIRPHQCADFTGEVRFYSMGDEDQNQWWEFSAYFVRGTLMHLETIAPEPKP